LHQSVENKTSKAWRELLALPATIFELSKMICGQWLGLSGVGFLEAVNPFPPQSGEWCEVSQQVHGRALDTTGFSCCGRHM